MRMKHLIILIFTVFWSSCCSFTHSCDCGNETPQDLFLDDSVKTWLPYQNDSLYLFGLSPDSGVQAFRWVWEKGSETYGGDECLQGNSEVWHGYFKTPAGLSGISFEFFLTNETQMELRHMGYDFGYKSLFVGEDQHINQVGLEGYFVDSLKIGPSTFYQVLFVKNPETSDFLYLTRNAGVLKSNDWERRF